MNTLKNCLHPKSNEKEQLQSGHKQPPFCFKQEFKNVFQLFLPSIIMMDLIPKLDDAILAMAFMHIGMWLQVRKSIFSKLKSIKQKTYSQIKSQILFSIKWGIFMVVSCLIFLNIMLYQETIFKLIIDEVKVPVHYDPFDLTVLLVAFNVFNPIVEELFWHHHFFIRLGTQPYQRLIINAFYTSYHIFSIQYILGNKVAVLGTLVIFIFGYITDYITRHHGTLAAIIFHFFEDFVITLGIAQVVFFTDVKTTFMAPKLQDSILHLLFRLVTSIQHPFG